MKRNTPSARSVQTSMKRALLGVTLALSALVAPVSAHAFDLRPSVQDQIKIGRDAAAQVRKQEKVLPDSDPRVKLVRQLGEAMIKQIPEAERKRRPFEYSFDVIDSKEVNAFALPGGPTFYYTGLIDRMTTVDQLAGVVGHEIIHVRNQHWANQEGDRLKRQLPLAVLLELLNAGQAVWDLAALADAVLVGVKYSRRHETEADRVGYDLMTAVNHNPQGMVEVFRMLGGGRKLSDFEKVLSTHPDPLQRADVIAKRIAADKRSFPAQRPFPFETQAMRDAKKPGATTAPKLALSAPSRGCWCVHHSSDPEPVHALNVEAWVVDLLQSHSL